MATYVTVFGILTWNQQTNFGTFGFDMGIYDQAIWLLSRFEEPFITVRGLNFFGHHVNLTTALLAPFYWLGAGPRFLYLVETIALAAGAIPLWLLSRHLMQSQWLALSLPLAYLLFPTIGWINWWHFHPDALSIAPLLFAWWFSYSRQWGLFSVAIVLALGAKEDVSFAVIVMGLLIAIRYALAIYREQGDINGRRTFAQNILFYIGNRGTVAGLLTLLAGIAWWLICSKLIIPAANGGDSAFYAHLFPGFGQTPFEVVETILRDPMRLYVAASTPEHLTYYFKIFGPTAFLSLLSPITLIGVPQLAVNAISAHGYTHDFRFYYTAIVIVGIFLGTAHALAWLGQRNALLRLVLPIVVLATSIGAHVAWSPSPIGKQYHTGIWAMPQPKHESLRSALLMIPQDAGVTASYYIVPHVTHRRLIYEFPNPFRAANWGIGDEKPGDPKGVDYLLIDSGLTGNDTELYNSLVGPSGSFEVIFSENSIELAKRKASSSDKPKAPQGDD
jgi:uncharacterized membrane protein